MESDGQVALSPRACTTMCQRRMLHSIVRIERSGVSETNEIDDPPFSTSLPEAQQMDYLALNAGQSIYGSHAKGRLQTVLSGPKAGHHYRQAREAEQPHYCCTQPHEPLKVSASTPTVDVIMAYRCCGPDSALLASTAMRSWCSRCASSASKEEAAACGSHQAKSI